MKTPVLLLQWSGAWLRCAALGWLLSSAALAENSFTLVGTPTVYANAGGTLTLAVAVDYDIAVTALSIKVMTPEAGWTYGTTSGTNVPQIAPRASDTGNSGDGYGFLYLTIPPGAARFSFTLKYPAKLSAPQTLQAWATLADATGARIVLPTTLTIGPVPVAPGIATQPADTTATVGGTATLTVVAAGTAPFDYQWRKSGVVLAGATQASLALAAVQLVDAGTYEVVVSNAGGTVTSRSAKVTVVAPTLSPMITAAPQDATATVAATTTFTVTASGFPAPTYLWQRLPAGATLWANLANTTAYSGTTTATLTIRSATLAMNGDQFRCVVTNSAGTTNTVASTLTVTTTPAASGYGRLSNLSVRTSAGIGDQALILGFVIRGSGSKQILVRGIGPGLSQFGVDGTLVDPILTLFDAKSSLIGTNDNWGGSATLSRSFTQVGAFSLPVGSKDAALSVALPAGACSAKINGAGSTTGMSLAEVYDADPATSAARFVNLAARNYVGSGDGVLVVGFAITGAESDTLLIRGIGPTLAQFGLTGVLANPQIKLFNQQGQPIEENDDWAGTAKLSAAFEQTGAFALPPNSQDSALLVTLKPGVYTAQLSGVANSTGVALIEVYEVR